MWLNLLKISGNPGVNEFMPVGVSFDHPSFASPLPSQRSIHRDACPTFLRPTYTSHSHYYLTFHVTFLLFKNNPIEWSAI